MAMLFSKISVLCPGLLGGSLAMAAQEAGLAREVWAWVRRESALAVTRDHLPGVCVTSDLSAAAQGADCVVLASPVDAMPALAQRLLPWLQADCLVTDVGSVKGVVAESVAPLFNGTASFIGSHPMAGAETTGVQAASPSLFQGAACVVTPRLGDTPELVARVSLLWQRLGCRVFQMTPLDHDQRVARISHLPHLLAAVLTKAAAKMPESLELCGPGFRDCTRVAMGSPAMWDGIFRDNRDSLLDAISVLEQSLAEARVLVESGADMTPFLAEAAQLRHSIQK